MNREELKEKMCKISNSEFPLIDFFNDIGWLEGSKWFNTEKAYEDIEKIYNIFMFYINKCNKLEKELKQTKLNFKNSQTHSKNRYKKLKEKFEIGKEVYHRNYELIQENGKLKQENQELKETLNKTRKIGLEIIEEKEQLSNELHKLNCYRNIELNENTKLKKALDIFERQYIHIYYLRRTENVEEYNKMIDKFDEYDLFDYLIEEDYELLKEVLEDE